MATLDQLIALYQQGLTLVQIGGRVGLSPSTVGSRLRRAGVPLRPRGRMIKQMDQRAQRMCAAIERGDTYQSVAERHGLSRQRVHQIVQWARQHPATWPTPCPPAVPLVQKARDNRLRIHTTLMRGLRLRGPKKTA